MQLVLTEDQELIQKTALDFMSEKSPIKRARALRDQQDPVRFSKALWKEMAELGWLGIPFPESVGGADLGLSELVVVMEAAGRALAPEPFLSTRMGLFASTASVIRRGLARTREALGGSIRALVAGPLSAEAIDEIEARLLRADVGPTATTAIIQRLREAHRSGELAGGDDAVAFLKDSLKQRLRATDRSLHMAPAGPTVVLLVGVNGSGKTTSLAKIAASFRRQGRSVMIAAADTPCSEASRSTKLARSTRRRGGLMSWAPLSSRRRAAVTRPSRRLSALSMRERAPRPR